MILVVGSSCLLLMGGFLDNLMLSFRESTIHSQLGHLLVNKRGYWEQGSSTPYNYLIEDADSVATTITRAIPNANTVPRIQFGGMLSTDKDGISVIALGVDPAQESRMSQYVDPNLKVPVTNIIQGKDLDEKDPDGILVGAGIMKSLNLKVGDSVSLITTRPEGAIDGSTLHVRGVFETMLKEVGERVIKVPLGTAQKMLNLPNQINSIIVLLQNTDDTEMAQGTVSNALKSLGKSFEIIPWQVQSLLYNQTKRFLDNLFLLIKLIMSAIFIFSIANTINMSLFERMKEYGTMMAIGNSRGSIFSMILMETAILAIFGSLLGILIAFGMMKIITLLGLQIPPPPNSGTENWFYINFLVSKRLLLEVLGISFFATTFSSVFPALRACKTRIIQALGYV